MRGGFYAVYGSNRACIYDEWKKVIIDKSKFIGHKVKKFITKKSASEYIEFGMTVVYPCISPDSFNKEALLANPINVPISVEELTL